MQFLNYEQFKDEFGKAGVNNLIKNILTNLLKEKKEITLISLRAFTSYFEDFTFIVYNRNIRNN